MTHSTFVALVARLDLNLYISLSECFPMVVLESISNGVPCLVSPTTSVLR
jgi:glycosyltransferase involved in cell wall biosynthesis